jgi:L-iditol 2-dehydrogenase
MKAMVLTEYKKLQLTDMPRPEHGPTDLLIRVRACGICGSDVHGYDGSTGRRIPPIVMGHEASGVVEAVGSSVKGFKPGDRVTFDSTVSCGQCYFCRRGQINLCDNRSVLGVSTPDFRRHGCFAEYVTVPQNIVYHLPDQLSFEEAAMIEAVSVAVHAVNITPVSLGESAVVVGTGMIGLLVVQAAKLAGFDKVIAVDIDDKKLALARTLGATHVVNSKTSDAAAEIKKLTDGHGAHAALECVGATATVQMAIAAVRKGGTVTLVGNISPKIELPLQSVVSRQIRLQGSCASNGEYPECIAFMASGKINVKPLISATVPLDRGPEMFDRLYAHEPGLMKVIVQP